MQTSSYSAQAPKHPKTHKELAPFKVDFHADATSLQLCVDCPDDIGLLLRLMRLVRFELTTPQVFSGSNPFHLDSGFSSPDSGGGGADSRESADVSGTLERLYATTYITQIHTDTRTLNVRRLKATFIVRFSSLKFSSTIPYPRGYDSTSPIAFICLPPPPPSDDDFPPLKGVAAADCPPLPFPRLQLPLLGCGGGHEFESGPRHFEDSGHRLPTVPVNTACIALSHDSTPIFSWSKMSKSPPHNLHEKLRAAVVQEIKCGILKTCYSCVHTHDIYKPSTPWTSQSYGNLPNERKIKHTAFLKSANVGFSEVECVLAKVALHGFSVIAAELGAANGNVVAISPSKITQEISRMRGVSPFAWLHKEALEKKGPWSLDKRLSGRLSWIWKKIRSSIFER